MCTCNMGTWLVGAIVTIFLLGTAHGTPETPTTLVTVGQSTEQGQPYTEDYYKFNRTCYEDDILLTTLAPEAAVSEAACLATCTATAYCAAVAVPVGNQAGTRCRLLSQAATALLSDCLVDPSNVEIFLKPQKPVACTYTAQAGKKCVESASRQLLGTFTKVIAPGSVADRDKCRANNDDLNQGDFDLVDGISELECRNRVEDGPTKYYGYEYENAEVNEPSHCELHKTIITNAVADPQENTRHVCFQYTEPPDTIQKAERCQQVSNLNPECGITVEFETGTSKCYCTASPLNGGLSGICTIQDNPGFTLYTHSCLSVTNPPPVATTMPTTLITETDAPTKVNEQDTNGDKDGENVQDGTNRTVLAIGLSGVVAATALFTMARFARSRDSNDFPGFISMFSSRSMSKGLVSNVSCDLTASTLTPGNSDSNLSIGRPRSNYSLSKSRSNFSLGRPGSGKSGSNFSLVGPPPTGILKAEKKRQKKMNKIGSEISGPTAVYYPKFAFNKIVNSFRSSNGVTLRESDILSVQSRSSRFYLFRMTKKTPPSLPPRPASPASSDPFASKGTSTHQGHGVNHHKKRHHGKGKHESHRGNGKDTPTESQKLFTMV